MPRKSAKHWNFWIPLLVFFVLIIGIVIGFYLNIRIGNKRPVTTIIQRNDRLEEIINLISDRYVDTVQKDTLYREAILGILAHLDPHTTYIPANRVADVTAKLKGGFSGIGLELLPVQDTMMVSGVMTNSPAQEAGFQLGDRILEIDSISIRSGEGILPKIKRIVGNDNRKKVFFTVYRPGGDGNFSIVVKKGMVPLYSVPAGYMISSDIGYIKISRFSAMTYKEFDKTLKRLKKKGLNKLILDLRDNPGGYVDAATAIANEFLTNKELIVYTEGKDEPRSGYYADKSGAFTKGNLVVLVGGRTASAAEILAGAIQDWDRGVLIGEWTFGKGLVQQQYKLGDGALLRLTIARYYTPSGRCIQRSYKEGNAAYRKASINRMFDIDTLKMLSLDSQARAKRYFSKVFHRTLRGEGGIVPDIIISDNFLYSEEEMFKVTSGRELSEIVFTYFIQQYTQLKKYQNMDDFLRGEKIPVKLLDQLQQQVKGQYPKAVYDLWKNPMALDRIHMQMKAELIKLLFGEKDYYLFLNRQDKGLEKAIEVINQTDYLRVISRKAA